MRPYRWIARSNQGVDYVTYNGHLVNPAGKLPMNHAGGRME
ncbi:hypothetical protein [Spirosoma rigui]|nr:hypothetical protein [Spirosoma rigui]